MKRLAVETRRRACTLRMVVLLFFAAAQITLGQTAGSSAAQLQTLQSQARAALIGATRPTTIVFDGTFTSTEGSLQQNGNTHLTVGSDGTFLLNMSRSKGKVSETRQITGGVPSCSWTDQNNTVHQSFNCLIPPWFFPGLTLLATTDESTPGWVPSSISSDAQGNHLVFQFMFTTGDQGKTAQADDSIELVLAPDTRLPKFARFMAHPDNPGLHADIPVRIAYSDYRNVSGTMIPFHIQRFVNESLTLDLAITTASVQ